MTINSENIILYLRQQNMLRRKEFWYLIIMPLACVTAAPACADGDPIRGKAIFNRCAACHSVTGQNGIGPPLDGIAGRTAGSQTSERSSQALKSSAVVWSDESLDQFLQSPRKLIPGTTMTISVPRAQDRADIIAFLKAHAPAQADEAQE